MGKTNYKWWSGVTEIDEKCSGCNTRVMSINWEGFCLACGKYETIIPFWSTTGNNTRHHEIDQEHIHGNNLSQLLTSFFLNDSFKKTIKYLIFFFLLISDRQVNMCIKKTKVMLDILVVICSS